MGGVEKYMTEAFLKNAFSLSLTESSVISVKVIRNKFTGERAPYAYINFDSDAAALMAMHRLTNKIHMYISNFSLMFIDTKILWKELYDL